MLILPPTLRLQAALNYWNTTWVAQFAAWFSHDWLTHVPVPLDNVGITGTGDADQVFNVSFGVSIDASGLTLEINDVAYVPPTLPTLLKILSGATEASDFNTTENINIINTKDSVIEINITGFPGHPFHLHGHSFDVVQSAGGERNLVNPPRRDVVVTAGNLFGTFHAE